MIDHIFFDARLDSKGAITELAAIRTDRKGHVLAMRSDAVGPRGVPLDAALDGLRRSILPPTMSEDVMVVSHMGYAPESAKAVLGDRWLFTSMMAWPLVYAGSISSLRLPSVCAYFKVPYGAEIVTAEGNARAVQGLYFEMMRRYRTALIAEEFATHSQGELLTRVRKFVGV